MAIQAHGGTPEAALASARRHVELANLAEIERAVRLIQVTKGKCYSQALEKNIGQTPGSGMELLGIDKMLLDMRITLAELDELFKTVNRTKYQFTTYSPLPEVADWRQCLDDIRLKNILRLDQAHQLLKAEAESKRLPENASFTPRQLKAAVDLGMWKLMFEEQRQACYMLLEWVDLPREAIDAYWCSLSADEKRGVLTLGNASARGLATQRLYEERYGVIATK